ncbi:MAG: 3-dehydroquinate synthase [Nitrospirae bacterium]|nr:MAG: 3-dehydroquinate synthase [Nitrospirota bacterium]
MQKLRVELGERSYSIVMDSNILSGLGRALERFEFSRKVALVSNPTVYGLFGKEITESLKGSGFDLLEVIIPDGEKYKSLSSAEMIYGELLKAKLDRRSCLIALGGGVIGDLTGYAASTYMRGIDFIQVPTTLLAQVDSSVGGKTGVNHSLGKNMIGTFWQPRLVWIDISTLKTLPPREFCSGLAEVIKYGVIWDREFFNMLEASREKILALDEVTLIEVIRRSCEIKAEVVSQDERESGLRAILNYGHTVGHAVETLTGYTRYLHGEAVAIGMHAAARLSNVLGLMDEKQVLRIKALIEACGLPTEVPANIRDEDVLSAMQLDKKTVSGTLRFVLPEKIGSVRIQADIRAEEIIKAIRD